MANHSFQWVNLLFLWSFSIAMLNYQRVSQFIVSITRTFGISIVTGLIYIYFFYKPIQNSGTPHRHVAPVTPSYGDGYQKWMIIFSGSPLLKDKSHEISWTCFDPLNKVPLRKRILQYIYLEYLDRPWSSSTRCTCNFCITNYRYLQIFITNQ